MMTSLKRHCLLLLAAVLLLSFVPTVTEVVDSMSDCAEFLLEQTPPQVPEILECGNILNQNRYKPICQTFKNKKRFVTLYDTNNKIPVFSAYKYRGEQQTGPKKRPPWKIEPQLEEKNTNNMRDDRLTRQASNNDYKNNNDYNRGHLFPNSHAFDKDDKISTFTLTNIVPQAVSFNGGSWEKMESCVECVLEEYCNNNNGVIEGFVVTGAIPGNNKLKNKINIPSILWSAFCCYSHNLQKWIASAHWGENIAEEPNSKYLQTKTLEELHQNLSTMDTRFEVFPRTLCPLNTTVAEFYQELKKTCKCPPQASTTSALPTTTTSIPTNQTSATIIPTTFEPRINKTNQTSATIIPTTSEPRINKTNQTSATIIPTTSEPRINKTNQTSATIIPTTFEPQITKTNQTSATIIPTTFEPRTNKTNQTSATIIPTTSEPRTNKTNQTSATIIPTTSEPRINKNNQTSATIIPTTSEPQTNKTNQTSATIIPTTSEPQTNKTNQTSATIIPTTSEPQTNKTNQTSATIIPISYIFWIVLYLLC
ncbi:uncharacterized protein LOC119912993 [Micropterus salmoides]|uniref:uncharacterized protein LOC119912993 n=1 Tax=Micropterus salmoides TaxID=27706 RepID=UPI0018EC99A3|nr:uncharacterized protein LOC119912993 [Micropterus salmoides]